MTREDIKILQNIVDIYEKENMYPLIKDKWTISAIKRVIKALEQSFPQGRENSSAIC